MSSDRSRSNPHTPPSGSPKLQVTLPTPPSSFAAHRMSTRTAHGSDAHFRYPGHEKRPSISSVNDPIVDPARRVSFSKEAIGDGQKSPVYQIPQRSSHSTSTSLEANAGHETYKARPKPRPLSLQALPNPTTQSRFNSTAASKGLSISPSLARGNAPFGSIWSSSATLPSNSTDGWRSPSTALKSATLKSTVGTGTGTVPSAGIVAKQRGLAIAIVKDNGGVVPVTPGLGSASLKSPGTGASIGLGLKSPELRSVTMARKETEGRTTGTTGLGSASLDSARTTGGKKEIILCKFYHTSGLTCTSRPCRFVHALSSLTSPVPSDDITQYTMLSPNRPEDPTSGTFAHAQSLAAEAKPKQLKMTPEGVDLDGVEMGEKVVMEDENGEEVAGHVFLMSGGGKGAGGRGKDKYKTVPCKDFAEGHCPYGDYCSFLHTDPTEKPVVPKERDNSERPTDTRPSSMSSSLSAWTKALPKALLVPSVTVDPEALDKAHRYGLSAFAGPFPKNPIHVDHTGSIIAAPQRTPSPADTITPELCTPPAMASEPFFIPLAAPASVPTKSSAWARGPPASVKKVRSLKKVTIMDMGAPRDLSVNVNVGARTPTSANHLVPPASAMSLWTESDPATPFDAITARKRILEIQEETRKSALASKSAVKSNLGKLASGGSPPGSQILTPTDTGYLPFTAPYYPWGMPMSPISAGGYQDPSIPDIEGGLGVMWTPAGWAVADAAMKNALRSAEMKLKYKDTKRRKPKSYYRTRPCRFYAEGFCPHGDECTFQHVFPASSPEPTSSSDSDSADAKGKPKHNKYQTLPCKFFNSAGGCVNGGDCAFLHTRVVPELAPLVERPRPWRTKPCRHYQLGRCMLGDACHFAHVEDPAWIASGPPPVAAGMQSIHELTEEKVAQTLRHIRAVNLKQEEEDDDEEDDIHIVTTMSPCSSSAYNFAM